MFVCLFVCLALFVWLCLTSSTLQRTGCLKCGIGPHHAFQCPHLSHEEAVDLESAAYRRWVVLIGEDLMMFGACSSIDAYEQSAKARMAARKDLPQRPPRYMKKNAVAAPLPDRHQLPTAQQAMLIDSPILRTPSHNSVSLLPPAIPSILARVQQPLSGSASISKPSPKQSTFSLLSTEKPNVTKPRRTPSQAADDQDKFRLVGNGAKFATPQHAAKSAAQTVSTKFPETATSCPSAESSCYASNVPGEHISVDNLEAAFNSQESWDANNVRLDDALTALSQLSQQVTRLTGDLEMMKARTIGDRRSRPFTPGSSDRSAKIAREASNAEGGQALQFADGSTQQILEGMSGDSTGSGEGDGSEVSEASPEYELWDLARYKRAKTVRARGHFWEKASVEVKRRMIDALLAEPAMSPATVQARQKGWIPF